MEVEQPKKLSALQALSIYFSESRLSNLNCSEHSYTRSWGPLEPRRLAFIKEIRHTF